MRAARLITGRGDEVVEAAAVRVEEGRIVAAGPASMVLHPADDAVPTVDYPDGTVLPGLIDAHVHLTFRHGQNILEHAAQVTDERALLFGVQAARRVLAAGVTTVRDCGARPRVAQALREGVRDGIVPGPRILASGPPVTTSAGHLWPIGYVADSADEARRAVRRLVRERADFIKVCATGGRMTPGSAVGRAQYSTAELRAVAEDAHRLGRHVAAHALGTEGIRQAVEAGIDTIEHCLWLDEAGEGTAFDEDVARSMAGRGIFANIASSPPRALVERDWTDLTPAHVVGSTSLDGRGAGSDSGLRQRWELARRMRALGVAVCFSTDTISGQWSDGHDLTYLAQLLAEAGGFAPLEVIQMITAVPARAIGWGDRLGTVEEGKLADLLVVEGNPATDIRALHQVLAVYQAGRDTTR